MWKNFTHHLHSKKGEGVKNLVPWNFKIGCKKNKLRFLDLVLFRCDDKHLVVLIEVNNDALLG